MPALRIPEPPIFIGARLAFLARCRDFRGARAACAPNEVSRKIVSVVRTIEKNAAHPRGMQIAARALREFAKFSARARAVGFFFLCNMERSGARKTEVAVRLAVQLETRSMGALFLMFMDTEGEVVYSAILLLEFRAGKCCFSA